MSLKYALLALLTGSPMSGYDIGKQFGSSVGFVWNAPGSQIYPELRRLAEGGLLHVEEEEGGRRKKTYSITETGLQDLKAWLNTPIPPEPVRESYILRAAYLDLADPDAARAQLQLLVTSFTERLHMLDAVLQTLRTGTHPRLAERLQSIDEREARRVIAFKVFAFEGMVDSAKRQIAWAQRGLDLLDELEAEDLDEEPDEVEAS